MLVALLQLVMRGWRAILAIFLAFSLLSVVTAMLIPRVYEGATLISYISDDQTGSKLASLAGGFAGLAPFAGLNVTSSTVDRTVALATLGSRQFSIQFIERHNMLPVLFPESWDATANGWKVADDELPTLADAFEVFDTDVRKVTEDKTTGLITVAIRSKEPERVAEWANALVNEVDAQLRQRALRDSQFAISFLQKELAQNDVLEVRQAVSRVLEAEISKATLANGREEYAFKVVDPAVTPAADEYVWPNRPLIIALGIALGLAFGFAYVLLREDIAKGS